VLEPIFQNIDVEVPKYEHINNNAMSPLQATAVFKRPTFLLPISSQALKINPMQSSLSAVSLALPTAGRVAHCLHSWKQILGH